ncbi:MAG: ThuA domain-containing protein [Opitutae bacterium]
MNFRNLIVLLLPVTFGLVSQASVNPDDELQKIQTALSGFKPVQSSHNAKVLVYSKASGFAHKSIPTGVKALRALAQQTKAFTPHFSSDVRDFSKENLNQYDGIIFNNTTRVEKAFVTAEQRDALLNFIRKGKGFAGFHGASDAGMPKWNEYTEMIGGCFDGHPWNAGGTWPFTVEDPSHPLCKSFSSTHFRFSDEIYQYKGYDRKNLRVLISLDANQSGISGKSITQDYPVSWVKSFGKGRVFYSNFGHNKASWWTPFLLEHFLAGIRWSLGELKGPIESLGLPSSLSEK